LRFKLKNLTGEKMNKEKAQKLTESYPMLFRKHNGEVCSLDETFGFECGSGWYDLINELCAEISEIVQSSEMQLWPNVVQVKEKFGGLRFYIHTSDFTNAMVTEADKLASDAMIEKIYQSISKAESKSLVTCEECGLPGKLYQASWVHVKCKTCEAIYQQKDILK